MKQFINFVLVFMATSSAFAGTGSEVQFSIEGRGSAEKTQVVAEHTGISDLVPQGQNDDYGNVSPKDPFDVQCNGGTYTYLLYVDTDGGIMWKDGQADTGPYRFYLGGLAEATGKGSWTDTSVMPEGRQLDAHRVEFTIPAYEGGVTAIAYPVRGANGGMGWVFVRASNATKGKEDIKHCFWLPKNCKPEARGEGAPSTAQHS